MRHVGSPSLGVPGQDYRVLIMRATQKLLQRVGPPTLQDGEQSTTLLGEWYATALFWKPQVALLVNETTLLPVLMPLAPAVTLPTRIAQQIATVLTAHGTPPAIVEDEVQRMRPCRVARTANRSVVGIMTEFTHLAEVRHNPDPDLLDLRCGWPQRRAAPCTAETSVRTANSACSCAPVPPSATRDIAKGHLDD
jgi:Domain of unknown function (DUF6933)